MKRVFISLLAALSIACAAKAESVTLSREECIAIALDSSPTVKVADIEVKRMQYAKREAQAGLYPTIDFQAAYQRSIELQTIRMDMGGQSQELKMGSDNTWNMGFNASLPLMEIHQPQPDSDPRSHRELQSLPPRPCQPDQPGLLCPAARRRIERGRTEKL